MTDKQLTMLVKLPSSDGHPDNGSIFFQPEDQAIALRLKEKGLVAEGLANDREGKRPPYRRTKAGDELVCLLIRTATAEGY